MKLIYFCLLALLLSNFACKDGPIESTVHRTLQLSTEDVGVTDAWIRVRCLGSGVPATLSVTRNGQKIFTIPYALLDTVLIDEGLLPKHAYTYNFYLLRDTMTDDSAQALTVTTMDTTSHNFTWEIDTLGDGGSSVLRDVAIINDTLAYAVGEIYKKIRRANRSQPL